MLSSFSAAPQKATWAVLDVVRWTTERFARHGIESARLDAELLATHAFAMTRVELYTHFDRPLGASELAAYRELVRRRLGGEPVAYLVGRKEFWSLELRVDARVLIPRPDTETLVEEALERLGASGGVAPGNGGGHRAPVEDVACPQGAAGERAGETSGCSANDADGVAAEPRLDVADGAPGAVGKRMGETPGCSANDVHGVAAEPRLDGADGAAGAVGKRMGETPGYSPNDVDGVAAEPRLDGADGAPGAVGKRMGETPGCSANDVHGGAAEPRLDGADCAPGVAAEPRLDGADGAPGGAGEGTEDSGEKVGHVAARARLRVADIGTGSGAVALALARQLGGAEVFASDVSEGALAVAEDNARRLGLAVTFVRGHLAEPLAGHAPFDLVAANLPYVPSADIDGLAAEVRSEPRLALDGGADGLALVRELLGQARALLRPGGCLALEIGAGQARTVAEGMRARGFSDVRTRCDLGGVERVVSGRAGEPS